MSDTITLTLDPGLLLTVALGGLVALVLFRIGKAICGRFLPDMPTLVEDLAAWVRLKLARDQLWTRSMETAWKDGFDHDADPFEFFAVGRDLVHDETADLLGIEPDLTDLAVLCDYIRRVPEVLDVHIIPSTERSTGLMSALSRGAEALAERADIPQVLQHLMGPVPCKDRTITAFGADFEAELAARFGPVPDLSTMAGLVLALESHRGIAAARITLKPGLPRSARLLADLTGRDPDTGLPFVSTAELSEEPAI